MNRIKLLLPTALLTLLTIGHADAKTRGIDSLKARLEKVTDTARVETLIDIGYFYVNKSNYDDAVSNFLEALKLAESLGNKQHIFLSLKALANLYEGLGKHDQALGLALRAQKIAEEQGNTQNEYAIYDLIGGFIYFNEQKFDLAIPFGQKMMKIAEESHDKEKIVYMQMWFGDVYRAQNKFSQSFQIYSKALQGARTIGDKDKIFNCLNGLGLVFDSQSQVDKAIVYYIEAMNEARKDNMDDGSFTRRVAMAYFSLKNYDKALYYGKKALEISFKSKKRRETEDSYYWLQRIYLAKKDYSQAFEFLSKFAALKDSLSSTDVQDKISSLQAGYESDKQKKTIEVAALQNRQQKILLIFFIAGLLAAVVFSFVLVISNRKKQKANKTLALTLIELKSTQSQLVQREKMASLGELTAGIAHEIQNPLNFVNNFSEINGEMLEELKAESTKAKAERDHQLETELIDNLIANERKINHHGKRADFIVKGMLEHSRSGTGEKQLTDLNVLCDEFMKLSYHGLRAKDKNFTAELITHFDEKLPKATVSQQDMGRVMLNLFNNAFYAVNQKAKIAGADYKPTVTLRTFTPPPASGRWAVSVSDNGPGIPDAIKDKIMQPFFTTKPTGEGTGLGLSLSYDIVVKGHGGTIQVNSVEGEGSEFVVILPV